jgi:hypothetical protein
MTIPFGEKDVTPVTFGYDVVDEVELGWLADLDDVLLDDIRSGYGGFGYDTIDVLHEGRKHEIPTLCTQCHETWLMGPEALAAGKCWRCRTGNDP